MKHHGRVEGAAIDSIWERTHTWLFFTAVLTLCAALVFLIVWGRDYARESDHEQRRRCQFAIGLVRGSADIARHAASLQTLGCSVDEIWRAIDPEAASKESR